MRRVGLFDSILEQVIVNWLADPKLDHGGAFRTWCESQNLIDHSKSAKYERLLGHIVHCFESLFNHPKFAEMYCQNWTLEDDPYLGDPYLHRWCPAPLNKKMVLSHLLNAIFCAYCVKWRCHKKHEADERRR